MAFARAPRMKMGKKDAAPWPGAYSPHLPASAPAWSFAARPIRRRIKAIRPIVRMQMSQEEGRLGEELGRIEMCELILVEEIGRGGLAAVHIAQCAGKRVACKVWRCQEGMQSSEEEDRSALERERPCYFTNFLITTYWKSARSSWMMAKWQDSRWKSLASPCTQHRRTTLWPGYAWQELCRQRAQHSTSPTKTWWHTPMLPPSVVKHRTFFSLIFLLKILRESSLNFFRGNWGTKDVKPANIAFTADYLSAQLLDFDAAMELLRIA